MADKSAINEKKDELNRIENNLINLSESLYSNFNKDFRILDELKYGWNGEAADKFYQQAYYEHASINNRIKNYLQDLQDRIKVKKAEIQQSLDENDNVEDPENDTTQKGR